jgi:hypothetical protein
MYGGINALIQVGKGNIQTRLLGGANVIVLMPMLDRCQLWLKN